jgi:hypothetical protein
MLFSSQQSEEQISFDKLFIGESFIRKVETFKYLGLVIDSALTWKPHLDKVAAQIAPYVGLLKRIRPFVTRNVAMQIYYAHIHSRLIYCLPIWSACANEHKMRIQRLQNRAIKAIRKKPRLTPSNELYDESFLSFLQLCDYESIWFIHSVKHGLMKSDVKLTKNEEITDRKTRQSDLFRLPQFMMAKTQSSLFYRGISLYNRFCISTDLSKIKSISGLKLCIKRFVCNSIK